MPLAPVTKSRIGKQRNPSFPYSPSPSMTSANSTPSKALAAKLYSMDQKPTKPMQHNKGPHSKRRPEPSPGEHGIYSNSSIRSNASRSTTQQHNPRGAVDDKNSDDDGSIGENSVSTIGSTESVFDRLYRQRIRSPRGKTSDINQRIAGNSLNGGRCNSFGSPVSSSVRNKKDRLGAYGQSTPDSRSVGYREKTPRGRTNQNSSSSVASSLSEGSDFDGNSSVFDRLYHNAKRTEKLWKKPKQFTPILSSSSKRKSRNNQSNKSKRATEQNVFFPDEEKDLEAIKHPCQQQQQQQQQPNKPETTQKEDVASLEEYTASIVIDTSFEEDLEAINQIGAQLGNNTAASVSSANWEQQLLVAAQEEGNALPEENTASIEIVTTLEEDLEAINQIGAQLANSNGGCSPTVAATSISSTNWEESSHVRRGSNNHEHGFVAGIPTIPSSTTWVDEEVYVIEAVGKQLEMMEADQEDFICSKTAASDHNRDQNRSYATKNDSAAIIDKNNSALADKPVNGAFIDTAPDKERRSAVKYRTMIPPTSNHAVSSSNSSSDNSGFFSLKYSRSISTDPLVLENNLLSKRADHFSCSIPGRPRNDFDDKTKWIGSAINIQRAWRLHRAELQLASSMIHSWDSDVQFQHRNGNLTNSSIHRQRALEQAVRVAKCWWILEGLHIEDNWITIAWENEVQVGGNLMVQVNLTCEAQSLQVTSRLWDPTKLAVLLVKAGLKKAICNEQASRRVAQWNQHSKGNLRRNATILQRWFRKCQRRMSSPKDHEQPLENEDSIYPANKKEQEIPLPSIQKDRIWYSSNTSTLDLGKKVIHEIPSPTKSSPLIDRHSHEDNIAAIKIQSFLRLTVLKSAVKKWPSTMEQLRVVLKTAGSLSNHETQLDSFDEFKAARIILCNTMIAKHYRGTGCSSAGTGAHTNIALQNDLITQRAAALAIHNIVRAYLTGLKKYRDKKRAILIQATFRGHNTRKILELEDLSAVVIQFGWSNCRYIRVRIKNATKIQKILRMVICKRNYEMSRFCIIFIQAGWRRAIVARRLALARSAILVIQRTLRKSRDRDAYLKFHSGIRSIQYMFKIQYTVTIYRKEYHIATILQSWWRAQSARKSLLRSLEAVICIQSYVYSFVQCRKFRRIRFDIILIQRTWRTHRCLERFESEKRAVLFLQTVCRKQLSMNAASRRRRSILNIQRVYRGHTCQNLLKEGVQNATKLQKYWRCYREHASYLNAIRAIITLQTFARFIIGSHRFQASCEAILDIQRVTRGWQCRLRIPFYKEAVQKELLKKKSNGAIAIQKIWRANTERQRYKIVLQSTIVLQKITRRILAQSSYTNRLNAARSIQEWLRGMIAESRVQKAQLASIKIQSFWIAYATSKHVKAVRTKKLRASSIVVQSIWRGTKTCHEYNGIRMAIIRVQASMRRKLATNYLNGLIQERLIYNSSILIQSQWRVAIARKNYAVACVAAITIQASARRMLTLEFTKDLVYQRASERAVILIQSHWRRLKEYESYRKNCASAITIQAQIRRVLGSRFTQELVNERSSDASLSIQRTWRGATARNSLCRAHASAIIIQASARRMKASIIKKAREYENLTQKCSILIQCTWRGVIGRYHYYAALSSAIIIQSALRRMLASNRTKLLRTRIQSLTLIQSHWRGAIAHDRYCEIRVAATMIQAGVRGMSTRTRHKLIEKSSILIQCTWRGVMGRYQYYEAILYLFSAITIQSASRRMLASRQTNLLRTSIQSVILMQSHWRGAIARNRYCEIRVATTTIQTYVSRMLTSTRQNKKLESMKRTVELEANIIRLQSFIRGSLLRKQLEVDKMRQREEELRYQKATESSILIQSHWRASKARDEYIEYQVTVIMIQTFIRGCLLRKQLEVDKMRQREGELRYEKTTESSILIQSYWRASKARDEYMQYRVAVIMIQALIRGVGIRLQFKSYQASIILSQQMTSEHHGRKHRHQYHEPAIQIQCIWNRDVPALRHQKVTESSTMVQSQWSVPKARGEFAATIIQAMTRGAQVRSQWRFVRMLSKRQKIYNGSARKIQVTYILWRMNIALWEMKSLAVLLKRGVRGQLAHSVIHYALTHMNSSRNSTIVDAYDRLLVNQDEDQGVSGIIAWHKAVSDIRASAAIVIQSHVRRCIIRNLMHEKFGFVFNRKLAYAIPTITSQSAAIVIQRTFLAWFKLQSCSAILIQKAARKRIAWIKYHNFILLADQELKAKAATKIQTLHRYRKQRCQFTLRKQAIIQVQKFCRGFLARKLIIDIEIRAGRCLSTKNLAVTKLQTLHRSRKQRLRYLLERRALVKIQNLWRKILAQRSFIRWKIAAHLIQMKYRCYQQYKKDQQILFSRVVQVQSLARQRSAQKILFERRNRYLLERRALVKIQNLWRKILAQRSFIRWKIAAHLIQMKYRCYQQCKKDEQILLCVVQVQSLARQRIARRFVLQRRNKLRIQAELALNQVLAETRIAGTLTAESLLKNHESMIVGPCIRRLADRVNRTLKEASSGSSESLPEFVHRLDIAIPLPSMIQKSMSPALTRVKSTATGTPVICNKRIANFDLLERNNEHESLTLSSFEASESIKRNISKTTRKTGLTAVATKDNYVHRNDDGVNKLANQASELLREARAAMQKKKSDESLLQKSSEAVMPTWPDHTFPSFARSKVPSGSPYNKHVGNKTSPEIFCEDSSMPSPISSGESKPDWDWTSEW